MKGAGISVVKKGIPTRKYRRGATMAIIIARFTGRGGGASK
jgi:hypothetical protein